MIHAHHNHSDLTQDLAQCTYMRMSMHTYGKYQHVCIATSVHTNTTSAVPQQGACNSANTTRTCTVQNLQPLKIAQPCPCTRGYHRDLIAIQASVTNILTIQAYQCNAFASSCVFDNNHTSYISYQLIMNDVQQHTCSWVYNNSNNSFQLHSRN